MLTTDYVPGAPNWVDLDTPDVEGATSFYRRLFGWEFHSAGPEAEGYGMFRLDGGTVAAAGPLGEGDAGPGWNLYFHTFDADATTKAVERAGGTVTTPPFQVFTAGRTARYRDREGASFAIWEPGDTIGLDAVTVPGSLCWTELYTIDPDEAKDFYGAVFDWATEDAPMGDAGSYTVIRPHGRGQEASQGGMMPISEEMQADGVTPQWLPYFEVADCDAVIAEVSRGGGSVLMQPMEIEGVGRFAVVADPYGAAFSVITSASP